MAYLRTARWRLRETSHSCKHLHPFIYCSPYGSATHRIRQHEIFRSHIDARSGCHSSRPRLFLRRQLAVLPGKPPQSGYRSRSINTCVRLVVYSDLCRLQASRSQRSTRLSPMPYNPMMRRPMCSLADQTIQSPGLRDVFLVKVVSGTSRASMMLVEETLHELGRTGMYVEATELRP